MRGRPVAVGEYPPWQEGSVPDTLQWWFGDGGYWRLRTYPLDHDIHAYQVANSLQTTLELAKKNNHDNYGDIIKSQHVIHFVDSASPAELDAESGVFHEIQPHIARPWSARGCSAIS
jgi:hypothetical protein